MRPFKIYNFIKTLAFKELFFSNILSNFDLSLLGKIAIYLIFWSKAYRQLLFFLSKVYFLRQAGGPVMDIQP